VFTGLSGSGKSSLAFDTIFAEASADMSSPCRLMPGSPRPAGQAGRRLHRRPLTGRLHRPKSTNRNPRSTVGRSPRCTIYLRLLYARAGKPALSDLRRTDQPARLRSDRRPGAGDGTPGGSVPGASPRSCAAHRGEYVDLFARSSRRLLARARVDGVVHSASPGSRRRSRSRAKPRDRGGDRPAPAGQDQRQAALTARWRPRSGWPMPGRAGVRRPAGSTTTTDPGFSEHLGLPERPHRCPSRSRAAVVSFNLRTGPARRAPASDHEEVDPELVAAGRRAVLFPEAICAVAGGRTAEYFERLLTSLVRHRVRMDCRGGGCRPGAEASAGNRRPGACPVQNRYGRERSY